MEVPAPRAATDDDATNIHSAGSTQRCSMFSVLTTAGDAALLSRVHPNTSASCLDERDIGDDYNRRKVRKLLS